MGTRFNSYTIKQRADQIVQILNEKGFVIQRYDSYSTNSIYLKLDYGVCNSIRISDHEGKKHLCYRYNMIMGCEDNIVEEKYIRYYFNESNIKGLINQILFDKTAKLQKYGKIAYKNYMIKNMDAHKHSDGFWRDAKLVSTGKPTKTFVNPDNGNQIELMQMPDGTYACGPHVALNMFEEVITDNMTLNANARFKLDEQVKVTVGYGELKQYYMASGETNIQAETHALQILGRPGYNVGTNLGATKCDEGMFYTIEFPLVPMEFLPEEFLDRC